MKSPRFQLGGQRQVLRVASAAGQREAKMEEQPHGAMAEDTTAAEDVDSQPLNDLGVSFMDQDELEKNIAAQVWTFSLSLDSL